MKRDLSRGEKQLLNNAHCLEDAAALIAAGRSTFGKWSVPGLLPQQGTAVLYGESGSGKSFFAIHLALCLSAALPWFGDQVRSGLVVYLAPEDRAGIEARAVAAASQIEGLSIRGLPLEFLTPPPIHSDSWRDEIGSVLAELEFRQEARITAVMLDTMGAAFGGNSQDDAAQMTVATDRAEAIAKRFGCLFLSVHHSGKARGRGMRGSQVLKDRTDVVIALSRQKSGSISAVVEKQRNGPFGDSITFRLQPIRVSVGDRTIDTCAVKKLARGAPAKAAGAAATTGTADAPADTSSRPARLPRDAQTALELLKDLANGEGATIDAWRNAVYTAFKDREPDAKRQAFNTAKRRLIEFHFISIDGDIVRSLA
jgi:hypothetical protein